MELIISGSRPSSVFSLFGSSENSATYALGWTMQRCPSLCQSIVYDLTGLDIKTEETSIQLQKYKKDSGFTDMEIISPGICHLIIEAKLNWILPGQNQLKKYASRINSGNIGTGALVSVSSASQEYAKRNQNSKISKVPLIHRSWTDIRKIVNSTQGNVQSFEQKLWLKQLNQHLGGYVSMQKNESNIVYVVSLKKEPMHPNSSYTWIDVVEKDKQYFHPVGNTWPVTPPNYIGFRYHGELQSVHHIESHKVEKKLKSVNKNWPNMEVDHFIYKLGPAMKPVRTVKSGPIHANRYECAIDTLLSGSCKTITEARNETKRRLGEI